MVIEFKKQIDLSQEIYHQKFKTIILKSSKSEIVYVRFTLRDTFVKKIRIYGQNNFQTFFVKICIKCRGALYTQVYTSRMILAVTYAAEIS